MAYDIQKLLPVRPAYLVNRGAVKQQSGLGVQYIASAVYDTAGNDSAGVSNKTVAAHGLGVFLPIKAIIIAAYTDVTTAFTSGTSAATIALKAQTANDIVAAVAINSGTTRWGAGLGGSIVGSPALDGNAQTAIAGAAALAATFIKLTAERELTATVGVEALTAGKMTLFVEYIIGA